VFLATQQSFYGREDLGLFNRLLAELPGILNWAIVGRLRLKERGHFVMPASSSEMVGQFEDLGSPIGAFVRDHWIVGAGRTVDTSMLFFAVWCDCCRQQNRHPGTAEQLGKVLNAAVPGIRVTQPPVGSERIRRYEGIGLKSNEPK
jgi:putative DNA primase/helicase